MPPATADATRESAEAFRAYVEPEIEVLLRVARSLTGSWADAEDVVQETLIRAYRSIDRFDGAHPRAWLLTILRRATINTYRRRRPAPADPHGDLAQQRPAFGPSTDRDPAEIMQDAALSDELENALATLDPRFRLVLLLIDVDQLSYAEAAKVLDIPVGTVMSRLSRARARMRHQLRPPPAGRLP